MEVAAEVDAALPRRPEADLLAVAKVEVQVHVGLLGTGGIK